MEAQGSQTATLASQRLNLALREADSEVTTGAWEKPGLWGQHGWGLPCGNCRTAQRGSLLFLRAPFSLPALPPHHPDLTLPSTLAPLALVWRTVLPGGTLVSQYTV